MTPAETATMLWIHGTLSHPAADRFFQAVTFLGSTRLVLVSFAVLALFYGLRRERGLSILVVRVAAATFILNFGIKALIDRPRPEYWAWLTHAWGDSFPSGHAFGATTLYGLLAWLLGRSRPRWKGVWWGSAGLLAGSIGFSRLYLGVHWPTDVLGGWALGAFVLWAAVRGTAWCPGFQPEPIEGLDSAPPQKVAGTF